MVPGERQTKAEHYRSRAQELRTIAQDWTRPESQWALIKIALDYERMADQVERMDASHGAIADAEALLFGVRH